MATILKEQNSLNSAFAKNAGYGLGFAIIGTLTLLYTEEGLIGFILIILGISLINKGSKFFKGATGEKLVSEVLNSFPDNWFVFNDIIVGNSQIDHIVICPNGIFTIETKNYTGTIYGNADKKEWLQVIDHYETHFYNPVKQGKKHSLELSRYLDMMGIKKIWVNTIVIFTNYEVVIKVFSPDTPVLYLEDLSEYLEQQKVVLNQDQVIEITNSINNLISDQ